AAPKYRRGLSRTLVQRRRCSRNNARILDRYCLRLNSVYLGVFLKEAIVQPPESVCCAFKFAHCNLGLTVVLRLLHQFGHCGSKLSFSRLRNLEFAGIGTGDALFLGPDGRMQLAHPFMDLCNCTMIWAYTRLYLAGLSSQLQILRPQPYDDAVVQCV